MGMFLKQHIQVQTGQWAGPEAQAIVLVSILHCCPATGNSQVDGGVMPQVDLDNSSTAAWFSGRDDQTAIVL